MAVRPVANRSDRFCGIQEFRAVRLPPCFERVAASVRYDRKSPAALLPMPYNIRLQSGSQQRQNRARVGSWTKPSADTPILTRLQMYPDFKELLSVLNEHRVNYPIVGAYAVSIHAQPRATKDLDILIKADAKNSRKVLRH